jgi:hypothetical protein
MMNVERKINWLLTSPLIAVAFVAAFIILVGHLAASLAPGRWDDGSTLIKVCRDGSKVVRMNTGEYRVLSGQSFRTYHAENADVCAP